MTTPESKAKLWLKHVSGWLNRDRDGKSFLSDPAVLLLARLEKERNRNELKKAWDIVEDLVRLSDISEGPESAEIRLRCGLDVAEMGNFKEAQKFFSEASSKYSAHSHHRYAIAQWMKGCMEWLLPGKEVDAINSWLESEKKFEAIRKEKENKKDEHSWYEARCKDMHLALHQAAEKYEIPTLPLDAEKNDHAMMGGDDVKNDKESGGSRSDRMGIFSVYEKIIAGSFGPSGVLGESIGKMEVEQVFIDDKPFRILTVDGRRFFTVSTQKTFVVKVSGDSMNKANIQSGDYVLLRSVPKNFRDFADADDQTEINFSQVFKDNDIVAAEIFDQGGNVATLKRIFRRGRKVVLQPQSTNSRHVEREFDVTDEGFAICGVVVAILKSV